MSLREEMQKYEQITGESAEHVPIIKLGAFLDGYEMGLKALEQQLCENYISRESVVQIIENKLNPCTDMFKCLEMSEIKEDVEHLPPVTPQPIFYPPCKDCNKKMDEIRKAYDRCRWIPCSERLPDECMNCLITVKTDAYFCNPHYENYIAWFDGKDFVYEYKNKSIVAKISIIAWQPLPESYKAESEEDN